MRSRAKMCFEVPMTLLKPLKQLSEDDTLLALPFNYFQRSCPTTYSRGN